MLLCQYNLQYILNNYFSDATSLPSKSILKKSVKDAINNIEANLWQQRLSNDPDFALLEKVHGHITPALLWELPSNRAELRSAFDISKLWINIPMSLSTECQICNKQYYSLSIHIIAECKCTDNARFRFLQTCGQTINQEVQMELSNSDSFQFTCKALGKKLESDTNSITQLYRLAFDFAGVCIKTHNASLLNIQ